MEKTKEEIIKTLEEDLSYFDGYLHLTKKHKLKLLNPKIANQVIASAGIVAYLQEKLKQFKGE